MAETFNTSCYAGAVGLARAQCPCSEIAPAGFDTSNSGLYIADLKPLDEIIQWDDCGVGSGWDLLERARQQAITTFIADIDADLTRTHRVRRKPWSGGLCQAENKGAVQYTTDYAGIRIQAPNIRGGYLKVKAIGGFFRDAGGTMDVTIRDRYGNVVGDPIELTLTANAFSLTTLATPIELPLYDDFYNYAEYFLTYATADAPGPAAENKVTCGCGNFRVSFNRDAPYYVGGKHAGTNGWANWVMVGGWTGDSVDNFLDATTAAPNRAFGLSVLVDIGCHTHQVLCKDALNFTQNPLAASAALAIQHKAAELAALGILLSPNLDRFKLANREALAAMQEIWRKQYDEHRKYISAKIDLSATDCLDCGSLVKMTVAGVFG